jgi:hypothetical protein
MLVVQLRLPERLLRAVVGPGLRTQPDDLGDDLPAVRDEGQVALEPSVDRAAPVPGVEPEFLPGRSEEAQLGDPGRHVGAARRPLREQEGAGQRRVQRRVEQDRMQAVAIGVDGGGVDLGDDLPRVPSQPQPAGRPERGTVAQAGAVELVVDLLVAELRQRPGELGERPRPSLRAVGRNEVRAAQLRVQLPVGVAAVLPAVQRHPTSCLVVADPQGRDGSRPEGERSMEDDVIEEARALPREHRERRVQVPRAGEHDGPPDAVIGQVRELRRGELHVAGRCGGRDGSTGQRRAAGAESCLP